MYGKIKKNNGEKFAQTLRNHHNGLLEIPGIDSILRHAGRDATPLLPYLMSLLASNDDTPAAAPATPADPFQLLDQVGYDAFYADNVLALKHFEAPVLMAISEGSLHAYPALESFFAPKLTKLRVHGDWLEYLSVFTPEEARANAAIADRSVLDTFKLRAHLQVALNGEGSISVMGDDYNPSRGVVPFVAPPRYCSSLT